MSTLNIVGIQTNLHWESIEDNLQHFSQKIDDLDSANTDVIILPEMFTTGFSMNTNLMDSNASQDIESWSLKKAKSCDSLLIGTTMYTADDKSYTNRLLVAFPDGRLLHYDKRYLFTPSGERNHYQSGSERLIFDFKGFKILPLICYDLRFSTWSDHTGDADLIIYTASWPSTRISHWDILIRARAVENLSYVVAVNRIGQDGNHLNYIGHSQIVSPEGEILETANEDESNISAILDLDEVKSVRKRLPYLEDK